MCYEIQNLASYFVIGVAFPRWPREVEGEKAELFK